jgi:hypothetical protein
VRSRPCCGQRLQRGPMAQILDAEYLAKDGFSTRKERSESSPQFKVFVKLARAIASSIRGGRATAVPDRLDCAALPRGTITLVAPRFECQRRADATRPVPRPGAISTTGRLRAVTGWFDRHWGVSTNGWSIAKFCTSTAQVAGNC